MTTPISTDHYNQDPTVHTLATQARATLHAILATDETWVGIHAAEMLASQGESAWIHSEFIRKTETAPLRLPRVGVWRVLALTSPAPTERLKWIHFIEAVFLDPTSPDRKQSIETLAKLGHRTTGAVRDAAKQLSLEPPEMNTILPLWSLHHSGDPEALPALERALASQDPVARQRAGYALRWIGTDDPALLVRLANTADTEPANTLPRTFLVSAAATLRADPTRQVAWLAELRTTLRKGPVAASYEAGQALVATRDATEPPQAYADLLHHPELDTRVAAASVILELLNPRD